MLDWLGLPALWDQIVDFFTISPFWFYLFWGIVIAIGATLAGWFFPPLRSLSGAIVFAIGSALYAYRRGETDAQKREREKQARERQRETRRQNQEPWKWPWEQ